MLTKEYILQLVVEFIAENESIFIVSLKITPGNNIEVLIDANEYVSMENCIALSRHIEGSLDREKEDFSLIVSSAGLSQPFKVYRQYEKNKGKHVNVFLKEGKKYSGKILSSEEDKGIVLETVNFTKKGKKKTNIVETHTISFDQIDKTKLVIKI